MVTWSITNLDHSKPVLELDNPALVSRKLVKGLRIAFTKAEGLVGDYK